MNGQEIASLIWHNGNIIPKEKIFSMSDYHFLFSNNYIENFFTSGTDILFLKETLSRVQTRLKIYRFDSLLFADGTGDTFQNETKRLLIRNKYYKTARCQIILTRNTESGLRDELILLIPDPNLFGIDKTIKKAIVSHKFLKPTGTVMDFPTMDIAFRKIIFSEIEHEKADDCIILNQDQHIIESYLGNIFLIGSDSVYTPSLLSGCTPLLIRDAIISIFCQLNLRVIEINNLQVENLFEANEVIVAGETGIYSLKGFEFKRYFDNVRKVVITKIIEFGMD